MSKNVIGKCRIFRSIPSCIFRLAKTIPYAIVIEPVQTIAAKRNKKILGFGMFLSMTRNQISENLRLKVERQKNESDREIRTHGKEIRILKILKQFFANNTPCPKPSAA